MRSRLQLVRLLMGLLLALAGCGDPRTEFAGSYEGTYKETVSFSNAPDEVSTDTVSIMITAPAKSDRLQFSGRCMFTATVTGADTIEFDPKACPTQRLSTNGGGMADFTLTLKSGTGRLTHKTLQITQSAESVGSNYSDGSSGAVFPLKIELTITKK